MKIRADIVAGLAVAGLMLPEAVAYAGIAGMAPGHAILAALVGTLVYALAGRSRFAIVSATSSSAAILAASLAAVPGGEGMRALFLMMAVALAGLLFLLAWAFRLGGLTGFISHPVLRGFAFGLAITISVKQLPVLVGVHAPSGSLFDTGFAVLRAVPHWHVPSLAVGLAALATLLVLRRWPGVPAALIVLVSGVAASGLLGLEAHRVVTVGHIALVTEMAAIPVYSPAMLLEAAQVAVPLALILLAESWGTMRTLALRHGDLLDSGRELRALGLANLASALVQGMPVGAGLSASAANEASGARSRLAGAVAALALGALVLFAMPWVALLPQPVLAAVVIAALTHSLDPRPILRLWGLNRDQYIALAAALGVLVLGVLDGMLCAILLSLAALVQRFGNARLARLGRLGESHDFVDAYRHHDAVMLAGIAIWRPAAPLFFANAERMFAEIARRTLAEPDLRAVVISLEESIDIDSTALDALLEFDRGMGAKGLRVHYARVHDRVRDLLHAAGAQGVVERSDYSVADAVRRLER
ncbi:SulP family inorganic anion transporter [Sphingomonas sp. OTU376]|uniref:SulP family inorganic anion transporter n=1 Tax=Sphingomonas sp. OTU376 TaxID=3043863 RepID=UPI00313BFE95